MNRIFSRYFVLLFISPALTLLAGLWRSPLTVQAKKWLLIAFITLYGSTVSLIENSDGTRHWERVYEHYSGLAFEQFIVESIEILLFINNTNTNDDLYIHVISYFTGTIVGFPQLFFVFVAFVYAYFFSSSLFRLFKIDKEQKIHWLFYLFALIFVMWKNVEGINTVRTWTGMWVLFYGCLSYYETKKWKYLLLIIAPVHIHIGYFVMAIPAIFVTLFGIHPKIYLIIFFLSLGATQINQDLALAQLATTEVGAAKASTYQIDEKLSTDDIMERYGSNAWYVKASRLGIHHTGSLVTLVLLSIFTGYLKSKNKQINTTAFYLLSIGILTKALSNFFWFILALGSRSNTVSGLFILASCLLFIKDQEILKNKRSLFLFALNILLFIPYAVNSFSGLLDMASFYLVLFVFVPWLDSGLNFSLLDFIKFFI